MEVAAGAIAAEQVVSTTIEGGVVAGVAIAQPTQPLKGTFTRFAVSPDSNDSASLALSHHSLSILHGKAYIYGGCISTGDLAGNHMHIIALPDTNTGSSTEYQCVPALSAGEGSQNTPPSLADHVSTAVDNSIYVWDISNNEKLERNSWKFNTNTLRWSYRGKGHEPVNDTNVPLAEERNCPPLQGSSLTCKSNDIIYVFDQSPDRIERVYTRDLSDEDSAWQSIVFPPSSPQSRNSETKLIPIATGHGRNYILLMPGISLKNEKEFVNDIWALQLPSSSSSWTKAKDKARDTISNISNGSVFENGSGEFTWAEVEIEARNEELGVEGKSLPGPLAYYAADTMDGTTVVIWGGVNAKGETIGDGWILKLK